MTIAMALNRNIDVNFKINLIGLVLGFIVIVSENIDVLAQRRHSSRHSRRRWEDGSIRLVGGRTENEGTVLIYHWSRWGAVCDDYWDIRDANVVCNELGFPGASAAPRESMFGKGRRKYCVCVCAVYFLCALTRRNIVLLLWDVDKKSC